MSQRDMNRGKARRRVGKQKPSVTIGDPTAVVSGRWLVKALGIALVVAAVCTVIALRVLQYLHPSAR